MAQKQLTEGRVFPVQGINFKGQMSIKSENLRFDITEFKKGKMYSLELNNTSLAKEVSNNWVFRETTDLFDQLVDNKLLEINDEGRLIVPMQVSSKNTLIDIKVSVPLKGAQFKSEEEERQKLYDEIAKIYKEKINQENILAFANYPKQAISFKFLGDVTNQHYSSFETTKNGKSIKRIGQQQIWKNFNHCLTLPNSGRFYFKLKVVNTRNKQIFMGVCGKKIKGFGSIHKNEDYIGLFIGNGNIYFNGTNKVTSPIVLVQDKSVFKMEILINKKMLIWYQDDKQLGQEKISDKILNQEIYPVVSLYDKDDIIEFID